MKTTIDEAIKHFNRVIAQLKYLDGFTDNPYLKGYIRARNAKNRRRLQAARTALEALKEKQERENLKPLTLEELKERGGRPVYVIPSEGENNERGIPCEKAWGLVYGDWNDDVRVETTDTIYRVRFYGKTWLAYDHEPKEM